MAMATRIHEGAHKRGSQSSLAMYCNHSRHAPWGLECPSKTTLVDQRARSLSNQRSVDPVAPAPDWPPKSTPEPHFVPEI